jgi:hypothetical protein
VDPYVPIVNPVICNNNNSSATILLLPILRLLQQEQQMQERSLQNAVVPRIKQEIGWENHNSNVMTTMRRMIQTQVVQVVVISYVQQFRISGVQETFFKDLDTGTFRRRMWCGLLTRMPVAPWTRIKC